MHKKAYLKHLENIGIEDPGTSKALSFMDNFYKHDAAQFNSTFGKKLTAHTRANTPLSNDHLTKETENLEKTAATMPDVRGNLSKLVSSISGGMQRVGTGKQKPVSNTGVGGAVQLPPEAYRTGDSAAVSKAEKKDSVKTPAAPGKPKYDVSSMDTAAMNSIAPVPNPNMISPNVPMNSQAIPKVTNANAPVPISRTNANAPVRLDPNMTGKLPAEGANVGAITPNVTMANSILPQPTQGMDAVNAQQQGMITPNVTMANLQAMNQVQVPGKKFGAMPFDPNNTMANRAIIPNTPRGESQPQQSRFGATAFDASQYQTGQIPGIPAQNAPITPQQSQQNPAIQPQQQGPQFNTGDINAITSGIGQKQMQGGIGMSNSQANQAISGLGPQKQNAVDPNASAAQQAAQAQQQPKIVNNTMKPQPEPKQEAQPTAPSKESQAIAKEKEQLGQLKQKNLVEKLNQRIKSLEQASKDKASEEKAKPTTKENDKPEPNKSEKNEAIKPKTEQSDAVDPAAKTESMPAVKPKEEAQNKPEAPKPEEKKPKKSETQINRDFESVRQARARQRGESAPEPLSEKAKRARDSKPEPKNPEPKQKTEMFGDAQKPKSAPAPTPEKDKTGPIKPNQQNSLRDESSNDERRQTSKFERPTQDSGESLGSAQAGSGRQANYAVGYTGQDDKKTGLFDRAREAFRGKVDDMKARMSSKKQKSVQQMDAIPSKPHNVYEDGPQKPKVRGEPKVNVSDEPKMKGTSPITGNDHPHSEQGQKKIHEHLLSALGQTKEEAKKKWDSLPKEHQQGAMIGATLLATLGVGAALKGRSDRRRERDREERRRDIQEILAASQQRGGGGYGGYGPYGGYGRY